jgi:hypothetical protein
LEPLQDDIRHSVVVAHFQILPLKQSSPPHYFHAAGIVA